MLRFDDYTGTTRQCGDLLDCADIERGAIETRARVYRPFDVFLYNIYQAAQGFLLSFRIGILDRRRFRRVKLSRLSGFRSSGNGISLDSLLQRKG